MVGCRDPIERRTHQRHGRAGHSRSFLPRAPRRRSLGPRLFLHASARSRFRSTPSRGNSKSLRQSRTLTSDPWPQTPSPVGLTPFPSGLLSHPYPLASGASRPPLAQGPSREQTKADPSDHFPSLAFLQAWSPFALRPAPPSPTGACSSPVPSSSSP